MTFWLNELIADVPHFEQALCREVDPALWFPPQNGDPKPAKALCAACVERCACLAWALASREAYGIWGGLTPGERERLLIRRGQPIPRRGRLGDSDRVRAEIAARNHSTATPDSSQHGPDAHPSRRPECRQANLAWMTAYNRARREAAG